MYDNDCSLQPLEFDLKQNKKDLYQDIPSNQTCDHQIRFPKQQGRPKPEEHDPTKLFDPTTGLYDPVEPLDQTSYRI